MLRHRMFCEHSIEIIKVVCFFFRRPALPRTGMPPRSQGRRTFIYKNPSAHATVPTGCKVTDDSPNKQKSATFFYEILLLPHKTSHNTSIKQVLQTPRKEFLQRHASGADDKGVNRVKTIRENGQARIHRTPAAFNLYRDALTTAPNDKIHLFILLPPIVKFVVKFIRSAKQVRTDCTLHPTPPQFRLRICLLIG